MYGPIDCSVMYDCIIVQVKPLIWIESIIERHSHSRVEYLIKVSQCV